MKQFFTIIIFLSGLIFFQKAMTQTHGHTYIVNSAGDESDMDKINGFVSFDTICDVGGGKCTLRAAIESHNDNGENPNFNPGDPNFYLDDRIIFNIPGATPDVIHIINGSLPAIIDMLHIDGTTQPGYSGTPVIVLDGTNVSAPGLSLFGINNIIEGLSIQSFQSNGIIILGSGEPGQGGHQIRNNFIGTDATGTLAKGNSGGIYILQTPNNTITNNLISGNGGPGIRIDGTQFPGQTAQQEKGNIVHGNKIGVNNQGTAAIPNDGEGILIHNGANSNEIGGSLAGEGNLISGNKLNGILITGTGTDENRVQNNIIGANQPRNTALPNGINGISIALGAIKNVIKGNRIEGNTEQGVLVTDAGTNNNEILNNFIGSTDLPNKMNGIRVANGSKDNLISQNNIGNNTQNGILITGGGTEGTSITSNSVIGNLLSGIALEDGTALNIIGGTIAAASNIIQGNLSRGIVVRGGVGNSIINDSISFNNFAGIAIVSGTGNAILSNSIFSNIAVPIPNKPVNGLGIDLGDDGVTLNGGKDPRTGPNNLQNFPVLNTASLNNGTLTIQGTLLSIPNSNFRVEFFSNDACDLSGFGEGKTFLGFALITTDVNGNASFAPVFTGITGSVTGITATATDASNNTSEFSQCLSLTGAQTADLALTKNSGAAQLNVGDSVSFTLTLVNKGPDQATGITVADTLPAGMTFNRAVPSTGVYDNTTGIWNVGTLNNGAQATLIIVATAIQPGTITNTAMVASTNLPDPDPSNNQSSVSIQVNQVVAKTADLALTKNSSSAQLNVGDSVSFTLTLVNKGPDQAAGINVADILPAGFSFNRAIPSAGVYNNTTGIWNVGTLNNGAQATLIIVVTAIQPGTLTNTARVASSNLPDPDSSNNQSSVSIQVNQVVTIESQIRQLIAKVEAFVNDGRINRIEGRILTSILEVAIRENREGNKKDTIRDLEIFQAETKFFIRKHKISKELISDAQKIINQLKDKGRHSANLKTSDIGILKTNDASVSKEMRSFNIYGNYPNPFSTSTTIAFDLANQSHVKLFIFDESGRTVATLLDKVLPAGLHNITWQPRDLPAGIYIVQLRNGNIVKTSRMVHVK